MRRNIDVKTKDVIEIDNEFVQSIWDYEHYALVYSKELTNLFENGTVDAKSFDDLRLDRFVELKNIENPKKRVFRKCMARNGIAANQIAIGCRTAKELGVKQGQGAVYIQKAKWYQYHWFNSEKFVKVGFVMTLLSLLCGILSFIQGIICCFF